MVNIVSWITNNDISVRERYIDGDSVFFWRVKVQ